MRWLDSYRGIMETNSNRQSTLIATVRVAPAVRAAGSRVAVGVTWSPRHLIDV